MSGDRYLHLVRQDCPLPPGTHVVVYSRDSGGEEQDRSVAQQLEAIDEYCQHHHLVVEERYVDEARLSSNTEQREAPARCSTICTGAFAASTTATSARSWPANTLSV
ncbi:MAG: recombinase family protein [Chloroflexi bacterium]|nr:recombinase family protein [Chloroflexota bacterium]